MDKLPKYASHGYPQSKHVAKAHAKLFYSVLLILLAVSTIFRVLSAPSGHGSHTLPINSAQILNKCRSLHLTPGPPHDFHERSQSDRFEPGTKPTLLRNASIWTGRDNGNEVIHGDLLLDKGIIKKLGSIDRAISDSEYPDINVVDTGGAWVSPGLIDLHSHLGVFSVPFLLGSSDTNSIKGLVLPWLRSLDGLNTHDDAYRLSISGGLTTANVLPGSADAIGGQAFVIKLRPTAERSSSSMLLEPPLSINGSVDPFQRPRWRQMKHACGENPSRTYSGTRMDTQWAFREGYNTARKIKEKQDAYCEKALAGHWNDLGDFPEDLQWEALVDVLRGRVKVHNHCYEGVDIDGMVRLTNEFKFSIAAFHHAHEAYMVPDLIKKAYGHPPAVAIFATNGRYKREAYRGSEFAPRILADNNLDVVMKSDHPVLNSRHLLFEAQQAHYFGLPANLALASVTSTPAKIMGQSHRIGSVIEGYDADIVIWDSHPLALGATPKQVYIDGIPQLTEPHTSDKPNKLQKAPIPPNFDKEAEDAIKYEGLPPLTPHHAKSDVVVFRNVGEIFLKSGGSVRQVYTSSSSDGIVVVKNGRLLCSGHACPTTFSHSNVTQINLQGGSISPGLVSYGSPMGLEHIAGEPSTQDGFVFDLLGGKIPTVLEGAVIKASDGLLFGSRDALLAYRHGITSAITAPRSYGFLAGLSTVFSMAAAHKLADGAVVQDVAALHVAITLSSGVSVSTQISALRGLLLGEAQGELGQRFGDVVAGKIPLVVEVHSADIIASLIRLKEEVERVKGTSMRLTLSGATEAHLLAREIGQAGIGVIVAQRPFPSSWEQKRIVSGPPLTRSSAVATLKRHNVTVGILVEELSSVRNTRFDMAWVCVFSCPEVQIVLTEHVP
ncbi:hypothetical protein B0H10DRAFT_2001975 [Mycena sp. CBHHK59/15]|nr:hypothetical protein B0H10DRAFT_2001975 [Mycena sp. CBHHK59/15]